MKINLLNKWLNKYLMKIKMCLHVCVYIYSLPLEAAAVSIFQKCLKAISCLVLSVQLHNLHFKIGVKWVRRLQCPYMSSLLHLHFKTWKPWMRILPPFLLSQKWDSVFKQMNTWTDPCWCLISRQQICFSRMECPDSPISNPCQRD